MRVFRTLLVVGLFCVFSLSAAAFPVHWTLTNVAFDDGGTASGSFRYDAATNTFSSVSVITTTGTTRTGAAYVMANPFRTNSFVLLLTGAGGDLTGTPSFAANLVAPMTDSGGTINFALTNFHQEESCVDAACTGGTTPRRLITGGSITADLTTVPTLSEWGLVLFGILLTGFGVVRLRT